CILANPHSAVRLDRSVQNIQCHLRCDHFDCCDLFAGLSIAYGVRQVGGVQDHEPGGVDLDARLGDVLADGAHVGQSLAEGHASEHAATHQFQRAFGHAHAAHAVVNPSWSQSCLCDLKTSAFAQQQVARGYAHIFEVDFSMSV